MIKNISFKPWEPQDLIDDLQKVIDEEPDIYPNHRYVTLCEARDYLKEFFKNREWISVKDEMPKEDVNVLVTDGSCWCGVWSLFKYSDFVDYWEDEHGNFQPLDDVTHWMKLPEPPKED